MISRPVFGRAWRKLCRRFNRPLDDGMADDYYEYLSPQLNDDEFTTAMTVVWARNKFFPRPDDFLDVKQITDYRLAWRAARAFDPYDPEKSRAYLNAMSDWGRAALNALGGLAAFKESPPRFARIEFEEYWAREKAMGEERQLRSGEEPQPSLLGDSPHHFSTSPQAPPIRGRSELT